MHHAGIQSRQVLGAIFERFHDEGLMRSAEYTGEDGESSLGYYIANKTARQSLANDALGARRRWNHIAAIAQPQEEGATLGLSKKNTVLCMICTINTMKKLAYLKSQYKRSVTDITYAH